MLVRKGNKLGGNLIRDIHTGENNLKSSVNSQNKSLKQKIYNIIIQKYVTVQKNNYLKLEEGNSPKTGN